MKETYFSKENHYKKLYHRSLAIAASLLIVLIGIFVKPELIIDESVIDKGVASPRYMTEVSKKPGNGLVYSSIYHPELKKRIDPLKYRECKTYIIREYKSHNKDGIFVISEFDKKKSSQSQKHLVEKSF